MIGDRLVITDYHRAGAAKIFHAIRGGLGHGRTLAVTVAGESGSGKSEMAHCLAGLLTRGGWTCLILGQDDYFKLPPRSNHEKRLADISWVGLGEVRLSVMDEHLAALKTDPGRPLIKPLVYFDENRIGSEVLPGGRRDTVIAEGTYTTLLANADVRAFINRDHRQTKMLRLKRARDPDIDFLEQVLEIEHREISTHRNRADLVIDSPEEET